MVSNFSLLVIHKPKLKHLFLQCLKIFEKIFKMINIFRLKRHRVKIGVVIKIKYGI